MLLPSLSEGAGSGAVEVVSPTKAEGLEVSGSRKESNFSCFYQDFNLLWAHLSHSFSLDDFSFQAFPMTFPAFHSLEHLKGSMLLLIFYKLIIIL